MPHFPPLPSMKNLLCDISNCLIVVIFTWFFGAQIQGMLDQNILGDAGVQSNNSNNSNKMEYLCKILQDADYFQKPIKI